MQDLARTQNWSLFGQFQRAPIILLIAGLCLPADLSALENLPFAVTAVESKLEMRYLFDSHESKSSNIDSVVVKQSIYETEAGTLLHGYIYHPNFMQLDVGGSSVFVQNRLDDLSGQLHTDDVLYNFISRINFLHKKPYPLSLYYERDNPSVYPGLVERLDQINTRYGLQFRIHQPLLPAEISINASKERFRGGNDIQIVEETDERTNIKAFRIFNDNHRGTLSFERSQRKSESGRRNLPIRLIDETIEKTDLDSRHTLGKTGQFKITNLISYTTQQGTFSYDVLRFVPNLSWQHSDDLTSYYRVNYLKRTQENVDTENKFMKAGFSYRLNPQINTSADLYLNDERTTGFRTSTPSMSGQISYQQPIRHGQMRLSASVRLDRPDRKTSMDEVQIFDDVLILTGLMPVTLAKDHINTTTIVVRNASRTQVYLLDFDYRVVVIGSRTEIERMVAGNIVAGEQVLVDYSYNTGGTLAYSNFNQLYQADWTLFDHLQLRLRYRDSDQKVDSGISTFPLNSLRNTLAGVRITDYPISAKIQVGGSIVVESQQEEITPFDRRNVDSYILFRLPSSTFIRVSAAYTRTNNHASNEDVDRRNVRVILRSRPWRYTLLSAELSNDIDKGPTIKRKTRSALVRLNWRLRKLVMDGDLRYTHEQQGDFKQGRLSIRATLTREI